jgi:hypothetical protein
MIKQHMYVLAVPDLARSSAFYRDVLAGSWQGFVLGGAALFAGQALWAPVVVGTTVLSLVLTVLDLRAAYAGAVLNALILGIVWLGPIIGSRLGGCGAGP